MSNDSQPRRRRFLRFLALHEDSTSRLAVKRLLERVANAEVIGAGTPEGALQRLRGREPL